MRHLLLTALFGVLFLFTACQKEDIDTSIDSKAMSFEAQIEEIDEPQTRGTPITTVTQMTSMGVFAYNTGSSTWSETATTATSNYMHNQLVTQSSGKWSYNPVKYWPKDDNTTLFAYAPHATTDNGITVLEAPYTGAPTIQYTVPSTCAAQPDLMVAVRQENMSSGIASMVMKHTLAAISFKVKSTGVYSEKVTKIAVKGVSASGTLSLDYTADGVPQWNDIATATDTEYTSGIKDNLVGNGTMMDVLNVDGYLMMIPQTLGADAKLIVTVNGEDREVSLSGKEWKAGERYTYNIDVMDPIIIGYFGGWNAAAQEYTKLLEVERLLTASDPELKWMNTNNFTGATNKEYGPTNINILKGLNSDLSSYPAARYCHLKNDKTGDGLVKVEDGETEEWYFSAQKQSMAMWIAKEGIPNRFKPNSSNVHWSSTESDSDGVWALDIGTGSTGSNKKDIVVNRVRCVRDVTPVSRVQKVINVDGKAIIDNRDMPAGAITTEEKVRTTNALNDQLGTRDLNNLSSVESNLKISHYFEVMKTDLTNGTMTWRDAINACADYDDKSWRLPVQRELQLIWVLHKSLIAKTGITGFDNTNNYWSATETSTSSSWYVYFGNGHTSNSYNKTYTRRVRCVRDLTPPVK